VFAWNLYLRTILSFQEEIIGFNHSINLFTPVFQKGRLATNDILFSFDSDFFSHLLLNLKQTFLHTLFHFSRLPDASYLAFHLYLLLIQLFDRSIRLFRLQKFLFEQAAIHWGLKRALIGFKYILFSLLEFYLQLLRLFLIGTANITTILNKTLLLLILAASFLIFQRCTYLSLHLGFINIIMADTKSLLSYLPTSLLLSDCDLTFTGVFIPPRWIKSTVDFGIPHYFG